MRETKSGAKKHDAAPRHADDEDGAARRSVGWGGGNFVGV